MKTQNLILLLIFMLSHTLVQAQNNALAFDGTDDYVTLPNELYSINLQGGTEITIEYWFKGSTLNSAVRFQDGDGNFIVAGWLSSGTPYFIISNDGDIHGLPFNVNIQDDYWHHIACVWKSNTAVNGFQTYVDGVLTNYRGSANVTLPAIDFDNGGSWLGAINVTEPGELLSGTLDEVRIWNTARTETEIRRNMYKELIGNETNLVAYYSLNETSGTTAIDETSNNYDGTLSNMDNSNWKTSSAMFGPKNALDFDGINDYVECGNNASITEFNNFSMEAWVKLDNATSDQKILGKFGGGFENFYTLGVVAGKNYSQIVAANNEINFQAGNVPSGVWTHLAVTFSKGNGGANGTCFGYVNGEVVYSKTDVADAAISVSDASNPFRIGVAPWDVNSFKVDGQIDEVRIWNDVRTADELRENMCKTLTGNEANLVAYYNFDNTTGDKLQDFSGNGNNGTLNNMDNADWVASSAFNTWLNTTSTAWNTATNWSSGSTPASTDNVGLYDFSGGSDPVIPTGQTLNNLVVGSGVTTQVSTSENLTINGNFFNYGNFTIASGGSLITLGEVGNNGAITMQQTLSGAAQAWHMISGPAAADISDNSWNPVLGNDDFYAWHEASPGTWVNYHVTSGDLNFPNVNGGDNFVAGKGYLAAYNTLNPAKAITGTPNTGNVTFNLKYTPSKSWTYAGGWNLLGNPYPSTIDWNDADRSLFKDNFAYIYDPNKTGGEAYITIDGGSADAFIAPFQGFMVIAETTSNNQNFTFTNAMRDHGGSFLKNQTASDGLLLRLSQENWFDETTIRLRNDSEPARDRQDAMKLFSFNLQVPQLYSLSADDVPLAVNSIPTSEAGEPVALGALIPAEGTYTISLQQNDESLAAAGLFLEDRLLGVFHKIADAPYVFLSDAGELPNRFFLHFGMVDLPENSIASSLLIWQQGELLQLTGVDEFTDLQLFDVHGKLLVHKQLHPTSKQQLATPKTAGVYVVRLYGSDQMITKKVVVY